MQDVGAAIVERLAANQAWWALVGGRLDWTVSPQETPFPRAVGLIVSAEQPDHFEGEDIAFTRFQLDVYSTVSAEEAASIARAAIPILKADAVAGGIWFRRAVEVEGPTDSGDQLDTLYVYRARTDFALLHSDEGV